MIRVRQHAASAVFWVLVLIAIFRITSTYPVFSQTSDEPAHLVTGLEWLQRGTYTLEPLHPPLARVAIALGPFLSGLRLSDQKDLWANANQLLFSNGRYVHNLSLARFGVLPFFVAGSLLVWFWSRSRYGTGAGVIAALLFTTTPVILAHSGVATTDIAAAAGFTAALLAWLHFLERPTYKRAAILGIAAGLAILCKFSMLLFLPAAAAAIAGWGWLLRKREGTDGFADSIRWRTSGIAMVALLLAVWAGYRFSTAPIAEPESRPHWLLDRVFGQSGTAHNVAYSAAESLSIPAPALLKGLVALRQKENMGHRAYLLGQVRDTGWWYYFPVGIAVKTTIPFLIFFGIGGVYLIKRAWNGRDWIVAVPVIAALAVILVCLPSRINIGVRHILPVYPLFAITAGVGASWFWRSVNVYYLGRVLTLALLVWQVTSSIEAHPDYLAYFNAFAGHHPEHVLVDSDLDWGQDLFRLRTALEQKNIREVSIAYAGSARLDLSRFGLPEFQILEPHQRATGWIAISLLRLKAGGLGLPADSFAWLNAYQPTMLVGRSIELYYVPESQPKRTIAAIER